MGVPGGRWARGALCGIVDRARPEGLRNPHAVGSSSVRVSHAHGFSVPRMRADHSLLVRRSRAVVACGDGESSRPGFVPDRVRDDSDQRVGRCARLVVRGGGRSSLVEPMGVGRGRLRCGRVCRPLCFRALIRCAEGVAGLLEKVVAAFHDSRRRAHHCDLHRGSWRDRFPPKPAVFDLSL